MHGPLVGVLFILLVLPRVWSLAAAATTLALAAGALDGTPVLFGALRLLMRPVPNHQTLIALVHALAVMCATIGGIDPHTITRLVSFADA